MNFELIKLELDNADVKYFEQIVDMIFKVTNSNLETNRNGK